MSDHVSVISIRGRFNEQLHERNSASLLDAGLRKCDNPRMKVDDVRTILRALNDANVRYLIVGGLAVVAHGYVRFTQDIDLVVQLERENVLRAMNALTAIGYRP